MKTIKEEMAELVAIINKANEEYYVYDNPTLTDQEFDSYLRRLEDLEKRYPEFKDPNSPTTHVGGEKVEGFSKVTHRIPMLSLPDVFNEDEVEDFGMRIKKSGVEPVFVCEQKIDVEISSIENLTYNGAMGIPFGVLDNNSMKN